MARKTNLKHLTLALALICLVAQRPLGLGLRLLLPDVDASPTSYYLGVLMQELLLWLLPALLLRPWRVKRLGPREPLTLLAALALPMGMLVQLSMSALYLLCGAEGGQTMLLPNTLPGWVLCVLAVVIAPAVCEEAFFRGGVLTHLLGSTSPLAAFLITTLSFALMHGSPIGLPSHLAVSACCTLLMMASGRCWPGMLLHLGYNAMALVAMFLPPMPLLVLTGIAPAVMFVLIARSIRWQKAEGLPGLGWLDRVLVVLLLAGEAARYFP